MDLSEIDDLTIFQLAGEPVTEFERAFLAALRTRLPKTCLPYCPDDYEPGALFLILDVDPPGIALVNVGLLLTGDTLQGDRISAHDYSWPPTPTRDGFTLTGTPDELAARAAELLIHYQQRPMVLHEWLHQGRAYADCYAFADTGERLAQMYRSDWAPPGEESDLDARGVVRNGWVNTAGMRPPDRTTQVRGTPIPNNVVAS